jgi:hypothetical protein
VFHCTAGKDRTGVLAALVLGLVGVSNDDIVADYALTDDRMPMIMQRLRGGTGEVAGGPADQPVPQVAPELATAKATAMSTFLEALGDRYGGPLGWAESAGLDDVVVRLRAELLDPA